MKEYFSISDFTKWNEISDDATQLERCEHFMSYYKGISVDELRKLPNGEVMQEYSKLSEIFADTSAPQFYPLIEIDGKLHGYIDISKMSLGEYVDLEKMSKDTQTNLPLITALLYRPIKKHKFDSLKYKVVNGYNVGRKELTNLWEYYELEPYDYSTAITNSERMARLPVAFAMGALSFFLLQTSLTQLSIKHYLQAKTPKEKMVVMKNIPHQMKSMMKGHISNIGDGLLQFAISRQLPSLTSQGISVLQI